MKKILFIGILAIFATASYAQADASGDRWKNVRSLPGGQRIVVETKDGKVIKGKFQSGDEQKMSMLKSGKSVTLNKDEIKRVYVGKKKRSILGGVIGGLGGLFLLGGVAASDDPTNYNDMIAGGVGLFGGAILGGKIGAKIHRAWLVYEAP